MVKRELRVTGLGESHVQERIRPIYIRYSDVNTTILASPGEIQIHLRIWTEDGLHAETILDEMVRSFELALGDRIYSHSAESLEQVVATILADNRSTIAAAESCTGGLFAERFPRIPGSSSYFLGGVVCYSNELKTVWADVPPDLIAKKGAVSSEVALRLPRESVAAPEVRSEWELPGLRDRAEAATTNRSARSILLLASPAKESKNGWCICLATRNASLSMLHSRARHGPTAFPVRRKPATSPCKSRQLKSRQPMRLFVAIHLPERFARRIAILRRPNLRLIDPWT